MAAAPLIHFAYFAMAIPAYLIIFIRKLSPKIFIIIYISSFFININPSGIITKLKRNELGEQKVQSYYDPKEDPILARTQNKNLNWYAEFGKRKATNIGGNAFAITLILCGFFRKRMTKIEAGLFSTGLLMASMANFGDFVFTFYSRTMANAVLYILATVTLLLIRGELLKGTGKKLIITKSLVWISALIFVPKITPPQTPIIPNEGKPNLMNLEFENFVKLLFSSLVESV